jgi:hypothetical protein
MKNKGLTAAVVWVFMAACSAPAISEEINFEPLVDAHIDCIAFYSIAKFMVIPEAQKEYELKSAVHYSMSHRFSSSQTGMSEKTNEAFQRRAAEGLSLAGDAKVRFISDNSVKCSALEAQSNAIIKHHDLGPEIRH